MAVADHVGLDIDQLAGGALDGEQAAIDRGRDRLDGKPVPAAGGGRKRAIERRVRRRGKLSRLEQPGLAGAEAETLTRHQPDTVDVVERGETAPDAGQEGGRIDRRWPVGGGVQQQDDSLSTPPRIVAIGTQGSLYAGTGGGEGAAWAVARDLPGQLRRLPRFLGGRRDPADPVGKAVAEGTSLGSPGWHHGSRQRGQHRRNRPKQRELVGKPAIPPVPPGERAGYRIEADAAQRGERGPIHPGGIRDQGHGTCRGAQGTEQRREQVRRQSGEAAQPHASKTCFLQAGDGLSPPGAEAGRARLVL